MSVAQDAEDRIRALKEFYGGALNEGPTTVGGKPAYSLVLSFDKPVNADPEARREMLRILGGHGLSPEITSCADRVTDAKVTYFI